jgi:hypothetical protein
MFSGSGAPNVDELRAELSKSVRSARDEPTSTDCSAGNRSGNEIVATVASITLTPARFSDVFTLFPVRPVPVLPNPAMYPHWPTSPVPRLIAIGVTPVTGRGQAEHACQNVEQSVTHGTFPSR